MKKIMLDTDIGCDCDDAGALAILHRLCDRGEAELVSVTHCFATPFVAGCIDAINRFNKREVPIGINYMRSSPDGGVYARDLCQRFENGYPPEKFYRKEIPDTLSVLRKNLAGAEDGSITFVVVGTLDSMVRLILSEPDSVSVLSGEELVERKIGRTVIMGGRFFETWPMPIFPDGKCEGREVDWEWNIKGSGYDVARTVFERWRGELVLASYEIGSYVKTLNGYHKYCSEADPAAYAYLIHNGGTGRCSWDLCAVLEAVRPSRYWHYHEYGKINVDSELVTRWMPDRDGRHTYLIPKVDYADIEAEIDRLVLGKNEFNVIE